jgi:hypothetical protein
MWRGARARAPHPQPPTAPQPGHGEEEGGSGHVDWDGLVAVVVPAAEVVLIIAAVGPEPAARNSSSSRAMQRLSRTFARSSRAWLAPHRLARRPASAEATTPRRESRSLPASRPPVAACSTRSPAPLLQPSRRGGPPGLLDPGAQGQPRGGASAISSFGAAPASSAAGAAARGDAGGGATEVRGCGGTVRGRRGAHECGGSGEKEKERKSMTCGSHH